jgi:Rrf2 family nitric oxide-sensitive transcriptional repressor
MRLTRYTDYSMRVLIYLAVYEDRLCSIAEIAKAYQISYSHLMKVVNALSHHGFVETTRGRGGGLKLLKAPHKIIVGDVVRKTEEGMDLADCGNCIIAPACGLTSVLSKGVAAMLDVFDDYTIADFMATRKKLATTLDAAMK